MNFPFKTLIGSKVSILLDIKKPDKILNESYVGKVDEVGEDWVMLGVNLDGGFKLEKVIIDSRLIISIWIYNEGRSRRRKCQTQTEV